MTKTNWPELKEAGYRIEKANLSGRSSDQWLAAKGATTLGRGRTKGDVMNICRQHADSQTEVGYKRFEVGKTYKTQGGQEVTITAETTRRGYECVQGDDREDDERGYRYNRPGDLGRCTGTNHDGSDPRNLIPELATDLELVSARRYAVPFADEDEIRAVFMEARGAGGLCAGEPAGAFGHERVEGEDGFYPTVIDAEFGKLYITRGVKGRPGLP